jgi:hypothetical protein
VSNHVTPLSSGQLNGQTLQIELVEPDNDLPKAVVIKWPAKPTIAHRHLRQGGSRHDEDPVKRGRRIGRAPRVEKAVNVAEALAEARCGLERHNPGNN